MASVTDTTKTVIARELPASDLVLQVPSHEQELPIGILFAIQISYHGQTNNLDHFTEGWKISRVKNGRLCNLFKV